MSRLLLVLSTFFLISSGNLLKPRDEDDHTDIFAYPFVVNIELIVLQYFLCAGVLISETYVVAEYYFCLWSELSPKEYYVRYNSSIRGVGPGIHVANIYGHPKFDTLNQDYNFAIVELTKPLVLGNGVQPIALPEPSFDLPEGSILTTVGWKEEEDLLSAVKVSLITNDECSYRMGMNMTNRDLCVTCPESETYLCLNSADGGPLVSEDNLLVAVFFYQYDGGPEREPAQYSRVTAFRDFIANVTGL